MIIIITTKEKDSFTYNNVNNIHIQGNVLYIKFKSLPEQRFFEYASLPIDKFYEIEIKEEK